MEGEKMMACWLSHIHHLGFFSHKFYEERSYHLIIDIKASNYYLSFIR